MFDEGGLYRQMRQKQGAVSLEKRDGDRSCRKLRRFMPAFGDCTPDGIAGIIEIGAAADQPDAVARGENRFEAFDVPGLHLRRAEIADIDAAGRAEGEGAGHVDGFWEIRRTPRIVTDCRIDLAGQGHEQIAGPRFPGDRGDQPAPILV